MRACRRCDLVQGGNLGVKIADSAEALLHVCDCSQYDCAIGVNAAALMARQCSLWRYEAQGAAYTSGRSVKAPTELPVQFAHCRIPTRM